MRQTPLLNFSSDRFAPYLPDESQVNPNVLGFELADWLSRSLAEAGIVTSYPNYEDWGWYLERSEDEQTFLICCSGGRNDDGHHEWHVFVARPRKFLRKQPASDRSFELLEAVKRVLANEGIAAVVDG